MNFNEKLKKWIPILVYTFSVIFVLYFIINKLDNVIHISTPLGQNDKEGVEEVLSNLSQDTGECSSDKMKIEMFFSGFYQDGKWYTPFESAYYLIDEFEEYEEIEHPEEILSEDVDENGCVLKSKFKNGSFYSFPSGSYVIKTGERYFLCDTSGVCLEMKEFNGVETMVEIPVLEDLLKDVSRIILQDREITSIVKIENDTYFDMTALVESTGQSSLISFIETKSSPKKYYVYRYLPIYESGFITFYDDIVGKAFKVTFEEASE